MLYRAIIGRLAAAMFVSFFQNATDLTDLVSSGRERKEEEIAFAKEYELKSSVYRAERFSLNLSLFSPFIWACMT